MYVCFNFSILKKYFFLHFPCSNFEQVFHVKENCMKMFCISSQIDMLIYIYIYILQCCVNKTKFYVSNANRNSMIIHFKNIA